MTSGPIAILDTHQRGAITLFTAENQQALCATMNRRAAEAFAIREMAFRAIDTGDNNALDHIAEMAAGLVEDLQKLTILISELKTAHAA